MIDAVAISPPITQEVMRRKNGNTVQYRRSISGDNFGMEISSYLNFTQINWLHDSGLSSQHAG